MLNDKTLKAYIHTQNQKQKNDNYQNYVTPDQKALVKCNKNMKLNLEIKH